MSEKPVYLAKQDGTTAGGQAGGAIGALIGMAIDAGINRKWEPTANESLLPVLESHDYKDLFIETLTEALDRTQVPYTLSIKPTYEAIPAAEKLSGTTEDTLLISAGPRLLASGYVLSTTAYAQLYLLDQENTSVVDSKPTVAYRSTASRTLFNLELLAKLSDEERDSELKTASDALAKEVAKAIAIKLHK